jgi:hypothetical protein
MVAVFWCGVAIATLGLLAILMIPELPMRGRVVAPEPVAEPGEGSVEGEMEPVAALAGEAERGVARQI